MRRHCALGKHISILNEKKVPMLFNKKTIILIILIRIINKLQGFKRPVTSQKSQGGFLVATYITFILIITRNDQVVQLDNLAYAH